MTKLKLTNYVDLEKAREGLLRDEEVRRVELEALVDTGASTIFLPEDVFEALGLRRIRDTPVFLADGRSIACAWTSPVEIELLGRQAVLQALVGPRGARALLGQIPLEQMDLVVEPGTGRVRTNPEHPDGPIMDLLSA